MKKLISILKEKKITLGAVESVTCGLFAAKIGAVSGASKVFKGSIVSYTVEEKVNVVGVNKKCIDKYSVVSKEVADEMAIKGQKVLNVDLCISITGNAGPTCEPGEEPVGSCYISIRYKDKFYNKHLILEGTRNKIRNFACKEMKDFILEII